MAWMIGIDEAGYGPNLGPLVVTCVAFRVPDELLSRCLWSVLSAGTRKWTADDDDRIIVDDSKRVYSTARGLGELETHVLAALNVSLSERCSKLSGMVERLCEGGDGLAAERWYSGKRSVPVQADSDRCATLAERFAHTCSKEGVEPAHVSSQVINARLFNRLTISGDSKGAVLAHCLMTHVAAVSARCPEEGLHFFVDKHGGRNTYAAMLQDALTEGMVIVERETMASSVYRVLGGNREIRFRFQPRADSEHFCVALASMISKYLRELLMLEFNEFWQSHVPDIKPTAGYPGDAGRFFEQIRPSMQRLGMVDDDVWRCR